MCAPNPGSLYPKDTTIEQKVLSIPETDLKTLIEAKNLAFENNELYEKTVDVTKYLKFVMHQHFLSDILGNSYQVVPFVVVQNGDTGELMVYRRNSDVCKCRRYSYSIGLSSHITEEVNAEVDFLDAVAHTVNKLLAEELTVEISEEDKYHLRNALDESSIFLCPSLGHDNTSLGVYVHVLLDNESIEEAGLQNNPDLFWMGMPEIAKILPAMNTWSHFIIDKM